MRKRLFDPEIFTDALIVGNLPPEGLLFYIGLFLVAEDSGVYEPNPLTLKMQIFHGYNINQNN
ncbi:hypothetical protein KAW65_06090 [candidate division WOR-3 bacterium]|nr:hypothetical protein [candidate division WOR-3 bacterium]